MKKTLLLATAVAVGAVIYTLLSHRTDTALWDEAYDDDF